MLSYDLFHNLVNPTPSDVIVEPFIRPPSWWPDLFLLNVFCKLTRNGLSYSAHVRRGKIKRQY